LQPQVAALLRKSPEVRFLRIGDGKGKPLGRSFRVKLWPTFVFLKDGQVLRQAVRPSGRELQEAFGVFKQES
jgi:thioredoxin 1